MLSGDNGILQRATNAKERNEEEQIREEISLAWNGVQIEGIPKSWSIDDNRVALQTELKKEDTKTKVAKNGTNLLVKNYKGYNATVNTTNGSITSLAKAGEQSDRLTIGDAYENEINIGDPFTYSAQGEENWIVFGKETVDGKDYVLLTSQAPIYDEENEENNFHLIGTAKKWLSYENDLNNFCAERYGNESKGITARSITLKDINNAVGFTEPGITGEDGKKHYRKYTFGTELDENKNKLDYYYPSLSGENGTYPYFIKAEKINEGEENETVINETTFDCNLYFYYKDGNTCKVWWEDATGEKNWGEEVTTLSKPDNMEYVVGKNNNYFYYVASRSVMIDPWNFRALFNASIVHEGRVGSDENASNVSMCESGSEGARNYNIDYGMPVRPVILLPSELFIEENNGVYRLID